MEVGAVEEGFFEEGGEDGVGEAELGDVFLVDEGGLFGLGLFLLLGDVGLLDVLDEGV